MFCTIQIFLRDQWRPIARFTPFDDRIQSGYAGCGGYLEYDADYVTDFFMHGSRLTYPPVSLRLPVDFLAIRHDRWTAFLLDLVPTGAGRRGWIDRLALQDNKSADWSLLTQGARHPVGWLQVVPGDKEIETAAKGRSIGFTQAEVAAREEMFLEYMIARGASVAGSSDVQGESPKLLLTEDEEGLLHADGALPDNRARRHWLVKFTRARTGKERRILRNEGAFLRLAEAFHANVHRVNDIKLINGRALFIPRFDRSCADGNRVVRFGLESFASAAGTAEFGMRARHEDHCALILKYSSSAANDLLEYLRRDILNVCLGNADNHARNHSFIKQPGGGVRLSPLYDFAPMFLSDEGYARMVRWDNDRERMAQPDWRAVGRYLAALENGPGKDRIGELFDSMVEGLKTIGSLAQEAGVEAEVIERRRMILEENQRLLVDAAEGVGK